MARLTFDAIAAALDLPEEEVEVLEWGGSILVRGLSRAAFERVQAVPEVDREAAMIVACVAEPPLTPDQAKALGEKSLTAYGKLVQAIGRVNGTGADAVDAAKSGT